MLFSNSTPLSQHFCASKVLQTTCSLSAISFGALKYSSESLKRKVIASINISLNMLRRRGIYSIIEMKSAGFVYTDEGDTAICEHCGIQLNNWTSDEKPFNRHAKAKPDCPYVKSVRTEALVPISTNIKQSSIDDDDQPMKKQKMDVEQYVVLINPLVEMDLLKQIRRRTFSHWSQHMKPSPSQLIHAGFFGCNVGDRVMCIYCNLICQQWSPNDDDPFLIHRTLSPHCCFVKAIEKQSQQSSIVIVNDQNSIDQDQNYASVDAFRWNDFASTTACHPNYAEVHRRQLSFDSWSTEGHPSVDDLVRAGFFYSGTKTVVTCFYCNGSLQNWGAKDDPKIEHARWFPNCAYAKQLCGKELYDRIQASKRAQQEQRNRTNDATNSNNTSPQGNVRGMMDPPNDQLLSRYVAARLDLSISQRLFEIHFKVSVVKRCWEDQIRLKNDDFLNPVDLWLACTILQKQIDHISGRKENITIPGAAMERIRRGEQKIVKAVSEVSLTSSTTEEKTNASVSSTGSTTTSTNEKKMKVDEKNSGDTNLCFVCLEEQRRLACIPCGHLVACVPCGHSLRSCPICRRDIEAFVRIYI